MDIVFRTATWGDKEAIENLFIEMLQSIYQTEKVDGYESDYLDRFFADSEDLIIVAELNNAVVGYISIVVNREELQYAYIDDFCVKKEYRNQGIGTQLLQRSEAYAVENGISDICLHVEMSNTFAQNLYKKNGYKILKADGSRMLMKKALEYKEI